MPRTVGVLSGNVNLTRRGGDSAWGARTSVHTVGRTVDVDELVDAADVAVLLGLSHSNTVHSYLGRYPDMPRPVVDRGPNRAKLWVRSDIQAWANQRGKRAR